MDRCVWRKDDMGRGRTGAALIGAAVALMVGGSVASAGPDPSVPEPSVPETSAPETSAPEPTIPVETSIPPTEPSVSADSETYTLTIMLPDGWPSVDPSFITVGVVADGATDDDADHVAGPMACEAFAPCAVFELAPGEYDLRIDVEQTNPEASLGVLPATDSDTEYDVTIVDATSSRDSTSWRRPPRRCRRRPRRPHRRSPLRGRCRSRSCPRRGATGDSAWRRSS